MERAIGPLRDRVEGIGREIREHRQERHAAEEEVPVLHERKMTIYEDAESGPLDELRFPPGLGREESETEESAITHSSEPTMETLVEEPDQVTESPAEGSPEKAVAKLETHEFPGADSILREEQGTVKELEVVHEEPVVGLDPSHVSFEEPAQEVMAFDEAQPSQEEAPIFPEVSEERPIFQEATVVSEEHTIPKEAPLVFEGSPILQEAPLVFEESPVLEEAPLVFEESPVLKEAPVVSEKAPIDQAPLIPLEKASNAQSKHLSSLEHPRPHTPPIFDDSRVTSLDPFPVTNDHEDQGYGTQEDEDRTTQASQRAQGKHVHWGSVEAQPAYERPQDEEYHVPEENSPPFSRLLLPAPSVTETQPEVRPERAARLAARRATPPPTFEMPLRKFEQGIYTVADVRWGMALDLSNGENRWPIAFGSHGWENNQQVSTFIGDFRDPGLETWEQVLTRVV
jgi:hypothetical protein